MEGMKRWRLPGPPSLPCMTTFLSSLSFSVLLCGLGSGRPIHPSNGPQLQPSLQRVFLRSEGEAFEDNIIQSTNIY